MARLLRYPVIRVILFWVLFLVLWVVGAFLNGLFPAGPSLKMFWNGFAGCVAAFLTTWFILRIEKRPFAAIGLVWKRGTLVRFVQGVGIGAVLFGLILLFLLSFLPVHLVRTGSGFDAGMLLGFFALVLLSLAEEVGFRGYPLHTLDRVFGLRIAQWMVATAFALYHIAYGWGVVVAFTGPFVWSFVFALSAMRSRGIAVPVGLHFSVNVLQGVFGMKAGGGSLWNIAYPAGFPKNGGWPVHPGLVVQIVILIGAIGFTELFIRGRAKRGGNEN